MLRIAIIIGLLALAACGTTAAQEEVYRIQAVRAEGEPKSTACWEKANSAASTLFGGKLFDMSNDDYPTGEEQRSLRGYMQNYLMVCAKLDIPYYDAQSPVLGALRYDYVAAQEANLSRLISGRATWGQHAQTAAQLNVQFKNEWAKATTQIVEKLEAAHRTQARDSYDASQSRAAAWQSAQPRRLTCTGNRLLIDCVQY